MEQRVSNKWRRTFWCQLYNKIAALTSTYWFPILNFMYNFKSWLFDLFFRISFSATSGCFIFTILKNNKTKWWQTELKIARQAQYFFKKYIIKTISLELWSLIIELEILNNDIYYSYFTFILFIEKFFVLNFGKKRPRFNYVLLLWFQKK